jgi:hypothetical protein
MDEECGQEDGEEIDHRNDQQPVFYG